MSIAQQRTVFATTFNIIMNDPNEWLFIRWTSLSPRCWELICRLANGELSFCDAFHRRRPPALFVTVSQFHLTRLISRTDRVTAIELRYQVALSNHSTIKFTRCDQAWAHFNPHFQFSFSIPCANLAYFHSAILPVSSTSRSNVVIPIEPFYVSVLPLHSTYSFYVWIPMFRFYKLIRRTPVYFALDYLLWSDSPYRYQLSSVATVNQNCTFSNIRRRHLARSDSFDKPGIWSG